MQFARRLTRSQAATYLREHGIPIGDSTLEKLCMRAVNQGPPVAAWWGRRPLYDPDQVLAWAEARLRPAEAMEPSSSVGEPAQAGGSSLHESAKEAGRGRIAPKR
jgi:hypothetical protein